MRQVLKIEILVMVVIAITTGCASAPLKTDASTSGIRAAEEVGAADVPKASLHLQLAKEELNRAKELAAKIEGHTDSQGSERYNMDLSQRRADAVRNYLVQRSYQADHIQARGLGEGEPVADNGSAEGRANNRRVEIIIQRESQASNR